MTINSLSLENIGPFKDPYTFNLSTSEQKNILLIGGKNGSGKTTILKAIKYGLFGAYALGHKTESQTYLDEIKNMLNTYKTNRKHLISIDFTFIENHRPMDCKIERIWKYDLIDIEEICNVFVNGKELKPEEQFEFFQKLRTVISPKLVDSFIFDGERVGRIIEDNEISTYLQDTFETIFNITVLEQMNQDLLTYANSQSKRINNASEIQLLDAMKEAKIGSTELEKLEKEKYVIRRINL